MAQYEIVAQIGAGGMGEVYRARDRRLDRDVAIKVMPDHLARDPEMRLRFEREARSIAALSHPGILAIHELAVIDGRSLAVMELLEGESLRTRLTQGPLPWRSAAETGARIAEGLAAAHAKGIIHRDLKPDNVFICPDGRPKILDFGLARSKALVTTEGTASSPTIAMTEPGRVLGTIGYMAPEQVRGADADAPADIFALGCTLSEMVTGKRAFARATPAESMAAILRDPTPDIASSAADIPAEYARVVSHCLEKKPEDRFQSAADVALALRSLVADSGTNHGRSRTRRTRSPAKSVAVLPFANLGADPGTAYLADGITESIINSLSQLPKLRVVPRSTVFRYKGRAEDVKSVALALNVRSLVTGRVVQQGDVLNIQAELIDATGESQMWGDQYKHPVSEIFAIQEEIAWHISEALRIRLSGEDKKRMKRRPTRDTEAYQEYLRGRYHWNKWSPDDFQKAVEHFERAIAIDPGYALAHAGLGDTFGVMGYYGFVPPHVAMPRARAAAERALALDEGLSEAHTTMALSRMMFDWDWAAAEHEFRRAIELNPRYPIARLFYAFCLLATDRRDEAVAQARRGAELDPLGPLVQMGLAWTLYFSRRYDESLSQTQHVLQLEPDFPEAVSALIINYEQTGQYEKAASAFARVGRFFGLSPEDPSGLGRALAAGGERGYWQFRLDMLLAAAAQAYVPPYSLAMVHGQVGQLDEAFKWLEQAIEDRTQQVAFLRFDPAMDPLRGHSRFDNLLRRVGLMASAAR